MVKNKYGKDGLELFHAAKVMSQEVEATLPLPKEEDIRCMEGQSRIWESDEERRAREIMEGAVETRPGHVEVFIGGTSGQGGETCTARPHWDAMDAPHENGVENEHGPPHREPGRDEEQQEEADETDLMQRVSSGFSATLSRLLDQLERMPQEKAARMANFLRQFLADLRRPAPHVRRPVLIERQTRLEALLSIFEERSEGLREEEQQWCLREWAVLQSFLEHAEEGDAATDSGGEEEPQTEADDQDARGSAQVVAIEDSQEAVEEEGSQIQVVRLPNGTTRDMEPSEVEMLQWAEALEAEAAEDERRREQEMWNAAASSSYCTWEQWGIANLDAGPAVKRARVHVQIQGEEGRVVRNESFMVALRDGEKLAYQVSVLKAQEDEQLQGAYVAQLHQGGETGTARGSGSTEGPHEADEEQQQDDVPHSMDHVTGPNFAQTDYGRKCYEDWKAGRASSAQIGRRFGFHILGTFASMLEDEKETMEAAQAPMAPAGVATTAGGGMTTLETPSTLMADGGPEGPGVAGGDDSGSVASHGAGQDRFSRLREPPTKTVVIGDSQGEGEADSQPANVMGENAVDVEPSEASGTSSMARAAGSSGTEREGKPVQTNLTKWLL